MKHEVTTLNTKKALAMSLKGFMAKKPLAKITISEIIADCGVNRKTFYYHFEDIFALLKWILEQEAIKVVKQFDLLVEYSDAIIFVMDYVEKNKHILNCAYDSMGRDEMKRFFYTDFIEIMYKVVSRTSKELKLNIDEQFNRFLADFYTEALAGMLINWFKEQEGYNKEDVVQNIGIICSASIPSILVAKAKGC